MHLAEHRLAQPKECAVNEVEASRLSRGDSWRKAKKGRSSHKQGSVLPGPTLHPLHPVYLPHRLERRSVCLCRSRGGQGEHKVRLASTKSRKDSPQAYGPWHRSGHSHAGMRCRLWLALSAWLLLPASDAGRQMPKLSDKKLCADSECSHPILIARALQDYYPGDCRFIPIRQGQLVYVYAMLKDRGNLFWAGSAQDSYYGQQEARIGHFPSSVVEETHPLMPASTEVQTTKWDFYCY